MHVLRCMCVNVLGAKRLVLFEYAHKSTIDSNNDKPPVTSYLFSSF